MWHQNKGLAVQVSIGLALPKTQRPQGLYKCTLDQEGFVIVDLSQPREHG